MKQTQETTLEAQISALQEQIQLLTNGQVKTMSLTRRLQEVRRICREKYFGSWQDMRDGKMQYGPETKEYSDYNAIMSIITVEAGLLFKYSRGKSNGSTTITNLIRSEDDLKVYESICERICKDLKEKICKETNFVGIEEQF